MRIGRRGGHKASWFQQRPNGCQFSERSCLRFEPLESRRLLTASGDLIAVFNHGVEDMRQIDAAAALVNQALGIHLPIISETISQRIDAVSKFVTPFAHDLDAGLDLAGISNELTHLGLLVNYLELTPDGDGNLLSVSYSNTWQLGNVTLGFSTDTGFAYFDRGVDGGLAGNISANLQPVSLSTTFGVDLVNGVPQFFVSENTELNVADFAIGGSVNANMAIRNLLNVDVVGPVTGSFSGSLTFSDPDTDTKLRLEQLAQPSQIVQGGLSGSILFTPALTAHLPVVGDLSWGGSWSANINRGDSSFDIRVPMLNAPSVASIAQLLQPAYQSVVSAVDLFAGVNLSADLPVVGEGLGAALGLPRFLTDGGLGAQGIQLNITPKSILDLINGNTVDLIRFEQSGGGTWSDGFSVPIAAAAIPLGPIPLTLSLAFNTSVEANYNYYVGMGIDTVGFYIDPATSIRAVGSIRSGLDANVSLLGLVGMDVSAGVGASVSLATGFTDPDPSDGRIYLDELLNAGSATAGSSLLANMYAQLGGQAFGYSRGDLSILFLHINIFDKQFTIASFGDSLITQNRSSQPNPTSQRAITGRTPLGSGDISSGLAFVQDGILTIDAREGSRSTLSNVVSVASGANGGVLVTWRGVGEREYQNVQRIAYLGNDQADRFMVGNTLTIPVTAYGNGGADVLNSQSSGQATLLGGHGNDMLIGGSGNDVLKGEDGDDQLTGNAGSDTLDGGNGSDTLDGGGGDDVLLGGDGMDLISGGDDADMLDGGYGDDTLHGGGGDDHLLGASGSDMLFGDTGNDLVEGGDDADNLIGGDGLDLLQGGNGNDVLFGDNAFANDANVVSGNDTLQGQAGNDALYGEAGDDILIGDDEDETGDDLLVGNDGDDSLSGGSGDDSLLGGAGQDLLHGDDGADKLDGGADQDVLYGDAGNDVIRMTFPTAGDTSTDVMHGGTGQDQLAIAGTIRQTIVNGQVLFDDNVDDFIQLDQVDANDFQASQLSAAPNDPNSSVTNSFRFSLDSSLGGDIESLGIEGLGGDDWIGVAQAPNSTFFLPTFAKNLVLDGGTGNDTLSGGNGDDRLNGDDGDDTLLGNGGNDVLHGGDGYDSLNGGVGTNAMFSDGGAGAVLGGVGREVIFGGPNEDYIVVGQSIYGSIVHGGDGNDTIIGGPGIDTLYGEGGDDLILGGDLGDRIDGGTGADTIVGEIGRDNLYGNDGNDLLYTYVNNDIRARVGLAPIAELTPGEMNAKLQHVLSDQVALINNVELPLLQILNPTPAQIQQLRDVQDELTLVGDTASDLRLYQSVDIDTVDGGDGNDTIYGSPFPDFINGGDGNDNIFYSGSLNPSDPSASDTIIGGLGADTLWMQGTEGSDLINVAAQSINNTGNNRIVVFVNSQLSGALQGLDVENVGINALGGNDIVTVNFGSLAIAGVIVEGGQGDDYLDASTLQSAATLIGGSGNDTMFGGLSNDTLQGGDGRDSINGGAGNDSIDGGADNDILVGGAGSDRVIGGLGDDFILAVDDDRADYLFGGPGNDAIDGGPGNDTINDGAGDDTIESGEGNDTLVRGGGNDTSQNLNGIDSESGQYLPVGTEQRVNAYTFGSQSSSAVAIAPDGSYVIVWESQFEDSPTDPAGVYGMRFDASGQPIQRGANAQPGFGPYEFRVNDHFANYQYLPAIAMRPDGGFVVSWYAYDSTGGQDGNAGGVYAAIYDAAGNPLAVDGNKNFRVNTYTTGDQVYSSVAVAPNGDFVITWDSNGQDGSGFGIYAKRYNAAGVEQPRPGTALVGAGPNEFRVNNYTASNQESPKVAMGADGSFIIVFAGVGDSGGANTDHGIYGMGFLANGTPVAPHDLRFNSYSDNEQTNPSVAIAPDGSFVVAWQSLGQDGSDYGIFAKRYDSTFTALPRPDTAIPGLGAEEFQVNSWAPNREAHPAVAIAANGTIVITWDSQYEDAGRIFGVFAQQFDQAGNPLLRSNSALPGIGPYEFQVNSYTTDDQDYPSVAMAPNGSFVIVWNSNLQDGSQSGVYSQRFDSAPPSVVNATVSGDGASIAIQFSKRITTSGIGNVTNPANWVLELDGNPAPVTLSSIDYSYDPATGLSNVTLYVNAPLFAGHYHLTAKATIQDLMGAALDGNWDGAPGDAFTDEFTVSPSTVAPPTILGLALSADRTSLVVGFSQEMSSTVTAYSPVAPGGSTFPAHWGLLRSDGANYSQFLAEQIASIEFGFNPISQQWEANLHFTSPLPPGDYRLIARHSLTDTAGRELDGNRDGVSSDDAQLEFAVANTTPTIAIFGPALLQLGQASTFTFSADDQDFADDVAGFHYAIDWNGDGITDETLSGGASLTLTHDFPFAGVFDVQVTVTDSHGGVSIPVPHSVRVNTAPNADAGGPYALHEGESLVLNAAGSSDPDGGDSLSFAWDLNGDGQFDDAFGAHALLSWSQLVALGIADGPTMGQIQLQIDDGQGGIDTSARVTVAVVNTPPVVAISGALNVQVGAATLFTFSAVDASPVDQLATLAFTIDWGDGSSQQVVGDANPLTIAHTYLSVGQITLRVTATDKDGGTSAEVSRGVSVSAVQLLPNGQNPALIDLVWSGGAGNDQVIFEQVSASTIRVRTLLENGNASIAVETFTNVTGRVRGNGNGGNDLLNAANLISTKATLDGGAGNNTLYGGAAGDLLIGGSNGGEGKQGNNIIIAGNGDNTIYGNGFTARKGASGGNNLILGGNGNDMIYGNFGLNPTGNGGEGGQNVIVGGGGADTIYASQVTDGAEGGHGSIELAGSTSLDQVALLSVLNEWTSGRTLAQRISNISGAGVGTRANGSNFLTTSTVMNDNAADQIYSDTAGRENWLILSAGQDMTNRRKVTDAEVDLP
jgi:Ca2+-binding RTX toxin-like protein